MKRSHAYGVALALGGGVCLSMAGVLLRHIESADGWQILFYRSISFFITLLMILCFKYRRQTWYAFKATGLKGVAGAVILALGSVAYVYAILLTTVANAVFIIGAAPLVTDLLAWVLFKELIGVWGLLAMIAAFGGIALMFLDGMSTGGWLGHLIALLVVLSFAFYLLIIRDCRNIDMLPATCLAGIVAAVLSFFMATDLAININDLVISILLGAVQFTLGFMLLTIAARYIAASEVALFSLSEALLAPIWVWLLVDEVPSRLTIIGCGIVFVSVVCYGLIAIRRERLRMNLVYNVE